MKILKDGKKRRLMILGKIIFEWEKLEFSSKYTTLNFHNKYVLGKLTKSRPKRQKIKLEYLKKYLYAADIESQIKISRDPNLPIWQLWMKGNNSEIPSIVKACLESVKRENPDKKIILLTEENIKNYVDFPEYIWKKYEAGLITKTHFSDLVRFYLLYRYGGIWCDATIYMTDKIPDFIENSDFFVFKDLISSRITETTTLDDFIILCNKLNIGTWTNAVSFIRAEAGNRIIEENLKLMLEYWKHENTMYDYLLVSYFLTLVIFNNINNKINFIKAPYNITTVEYGVLQNCLFEKFDNSLFEQIKKITSIHKLTYKDTDKNVLIDSFYNHLVTHK